MTFLSFIFLLVYTVGEVVAITPCRAPRTGEREERGYLQMGDHMLATDWTLPLETRGRG